MVAEEYRIRAHAASVAYHAPPLHATSGPTQTQIGNFFKPTVPTGPKTWCPQSGVTVCKINKRHRFGKKQQQHTQQPTQNVVTTQTAAGRTFPTGDVTFNIKVDNRWSYSLSICRLLSTKFPSALDWPHHSLLLRMVRSPVQTTLVRRLWLHLVLTLIRWNGSATQTRMSTMMSFRHTRGCFPLW